MKTILCIILTTLSGIASASTLQDCKTIEVNYIEVNAAHPEGIYTVGDTDDLSHFGKEEASRRAEVILKDKTVKSNLVYGHAGECTVQVTYTLPVYNFKAGK